MTDEQLNEKIAFLMGKHLPETARRMPGRYLPDYLDGKHLGELMELAEKGDRSWAIWSEKDGGGRSYYAGLGDMKAAPEPDKNGKTPSLALARAIVAHVESARDKPHPTTQDQVTVTCPAPPEPLP